MAMRECVVLFAVLTQIWGFQLELENTPKIEESLQMPGTYQERIVGGVEADIKDYPHQVSFVVNNTYFCGGFIVSESWILTAGHCALDVDSSTVVLRAGSSYRTNGTIIPIAEVIPHPEYNNLSFDYDVGVMKTVNPIPINNETIMPIPLPPEGRPIPFGTNIDVSGFGKTQYGNTTIPDRLMSVEIPVVLYATCLLVYPTTLTTNQFCAGNYLLGGKGTCQGDSGGAALQGGMAIGIVSNGRGCGQLLSPSVFTNIAAPSIRQFINLHTGL